MIRLEFEGNYGEARKIHHQFTELYKLLFVDGNPAGVKALLNDMGMIENVLRLPLVPTEVTTKQKMADILKALHVDKKKKTGTGRPWDRGRKTQDPDRLFPIRHPIAQTDCFHLPLSKQNRR